MKRIYCMVALLAAMVAATSCEKVINGPITDEPYIAFYEDQMIVSAEGGEFYVPITSTGINNASLDSGDNWVQDENGDLLPIDEWIEIVKVINEYDAEVEGTRALAKWDSAIVIKVQPNETGYVRSASLSANSFMISDHIIIRQSAMAE